VAVTDPPGTVLDTKNLARLAPRHVVIEQRALGELSKLSAPASIAVDWRNILSYRHRLTSELAKLGRVAKAGDVAAIRNLGVVKQRLHSELEAVATRAGFNECGKTGISTVSLARPPSPPARVRPRKGRTA
jgi:hypothetical protein